MPRLIEGAFLYRHRDEGQMYLTTATLPPSVAGYEIKSILHERYMIQELVGASVVLEMTQTETRR